jgi:histidinol-phosphate aminotransferase
MKFTAPPPRPSIANPKLWRPTSWDSKLRPENVLWLDRGECIDPEMMRLVQAISIDLPMHAYFAYPTPGPLYRKLARQLGMSPDRLLLTRGTDGAIKTVFETFVEPDDVVVVTRPTYQMYGVYAQLYGARLSFVDYQMVDGFPHIAPGTMSAAIRAVRPRLVTLPYPDNPVGYAFAEDELRDVVEAAGEVGALMLVDEAYYPFHDATALPWVETYGHLVVARTFSKAWGMAGIRLGYTVAAPAITEYMHKVKPMVEADGVAMEMAIRMLDHEADMLASVARLKNGRKWFADEMNGLGFHAINTPCNFVHVDFHAKRAQIELALENIACYRVFPDGLLNRYLRFTTTTPELFAPVVDAVKRVHNT